jgi:Ca2+-binding RTX toxin-like protein
VHGRELWITAEEEPPEEPPTDFDLSRRNRAAIVDDPASPGQRVLLVVGGSANDVIVIEPRPSNRQVDGRLTKGAELHGGAGNDVLIGGGGSDQIFGEQGIDSLHGGRGNDVILGGNGNDALFGGLGRDVLIGGNGRDRLFGQQDDDVLIGSSTELDADASALAELSAAWSGRGSVASRITAVAALLPAESIASDGAADELFGGPGRDWFLDFDSEDLLRDFNRSSRNGDRRN